MEKVELCSCCKTEVETQKAWHFTVPDVGYGSKFDYVDPNRTMQITLCMSCWDKMNKWLIDHYPRINLLDFWRFKINDISKSEGLPEGYMQELQYDDELFRLMMRFMPEVYLNKKINIAQRYIYRIIYAPIFRRK